MLGLAGLIELGHSRFCTWTDEVLATLQSKPTLTSFADVVDALASHRRLEAEISRNYAQQSDLQELRAGMVSIGQPVTAIDMVITQFFSLMEAVTNAAKVKRQQLEAAKKSLEKLEDAKQREAKAQEKVLSTFTTSVTAAFSSLGGMSDLAEFPVSSWPYEQLENYSKELPSLEESMTKHLTQVQRAEIMLFDAKITEDVLSCVSDNLKDELARFAQELRSQKKIVAAEIDRRSRSPVSTTGQMSKSPSTSQLVCDTPTADPIKVTLTAPGDREPRFTFAESRNSVYERGSVSRSHMRDDEAKHRSFEMNYTAAQDAKAIVLKNFANSVCHAIPFFGNTADFPKQMPPSHSISKDPSPPTVAFTDSEKYIVRMLSFIQEHGTHSENIFSVRGPETEQAALEIFLKDVRSGLNANLTAFNVHSVATALKRFLAAGEPLLPATFFDSLASIISGSGSKAQQIKECVMKGLTPAKIYCLGKLLHVLTTICSNHNDTKMNDRGLAHVFAPHIFKRDGPSSNLYQIMTDIKSAEAILTKMIEEAHLVYGEEAVVDVRLPDAIDFAHWPDERLFAFADALEASDAKLTETGSTLWADLQRAHARVVPLKLEHLLNILSSVERQRNEFILGQTRRRDSCALELQRRGHREAHARTRGEKDHELEMLFAKQRSALIAWLAKAEEIATVKDKSAMNAGELVAFAERAEIASILVAATDSAMELELKGSEWEALLDLKQRVDDVLQSLSKFA